MRTTLNFLVVSGKRRGRKSDSKPNSERISGGGMQVKNRIVLVALIALALAVCSACGNGIDKLPGTGTSGGSLSVQLVQSPPSVVVAGSATALAANVLNDKANAGVTWSCTPAKACGSFSPATTGYQITTVYTAPVAPPNAPITTST